MALSDKANAANAKWATYRKRSKHAVASNGMYNPATGQTVKWTNMATVVDMDKDSENYYDVLGINRMKKRFLKDSLMSSSSLLTLVLVLVVFSLTPKNCKSQSMMKLSIDLTVNCGRQKWQKNTREQPTVESLNR